MTPAFAVKVANACRVAGCLRPQVTGKWRKRDWKLNRTTLEFREQCPYCELHLGLYHRAKYEKAGPYGVPQLARNERRYDAFGYVTLNGRTEQRIVMEHLLGRPLKPHECVVHKNGKRDDNRPANLELRYYGLAREVDTSKEDRERNRMRDELLAARQVSLFGAGGER